MGVDCSPKRLIEKRMKVEYTCLIYLKNQAIIYTSSSQRDQILSKGIDKALEDKQTLILCLKSANPPTASMEPSFLAAKPWGLWFGDTTLVEIKNPQTMARI